MRFFSKGPSVKLCGGLCLNVLVGFLFLLIFACSDPAAGGGDSQPEPTQEITGTVEDGTPIPSSAPTPSPNPGLTNIQAILSLEQQMMPNSSTVALSVRLNNWGNPVINSAETPVNIRINGLVPSSQAGNVYYFNLLPPFEPGEAFSLIIGVDSVSINQILTVPSIPTNMTPNTSTAPVDSTQDVLLSWDPITQNIPKTINFFIDGAFSASESSYLYSLPDPGASQFTIPAGVLVEGFNVAGDEIALTFTCESSGDLTGSQFQSGSTFSIKYINDYFLYTE